VTGRRARRAVALAAAVGLVVSAAASVGAADNAAANEGAATPAQGGEIVVGTVFDVFGLEPTTFLSGTHDLFIGMGLYDPLAIRTAEGVVEPWLAESIATDDQQTYTITLHDGVMFQDDTPVDAEAVKFNIERHMDPANESRALGQASNIESVTVVDPLTVEIKLKFPWTVFPEVLSGTMGFIASRTAVAGGNINTEPVGSGPYRLEERVPGDHTTLVRNEDYWREGEPYLDRITFRVMLDNDVRQTSVANGEIQVAQSIRADTLADADAADGLWASVTAGNGNTIHMNNSVAPMDDVRVRRALAHAVDYEALNTVIFSGAAEVTHSFIEADSPFNDPTVEWPEFDSSQAQELVDEYEAEVGPIAFEFRCFNEPAWVQLSELVTQMWTAVGIDVTVNITDQNSFALDVFQGEYSVACYATSVATTDPDLMFYNQLYSTSPTNNSRYVNPEMDAALDVGRTSTDEATRAEAYSTVQHMLATDVPFFQYLASPWGWVVVDGVGGLDSLQNAGFAPGLVYLEAEG